MESVVCPNCGRKNEIRGLSKTKFKCKSCKAIFDIEYEDETGNTYPGGWEGFSQRHPKFVKVLGWTAIAALAAGGAALAIHSKMESAADTLQTPDGSSGTGSDNTFPLNPTLSGSSDDWDDWSSSFGSESCRTCGFPLAGSEYTDPWEDDDNEYGYWKCDNCGAVNYDWDSSDD